MEASFHISVSEQEALDFAKISGDWNPLHTDPEYAATTKFKAPILHGAFSAGLFSRLAGMFIPGKSCLLHAINLRFHAPIILPVELTISGQLQYEVEDGGKVEVKIKDEATDRLYVSGNYSFGFHETSSKKTVFLKEEIVPPPTPDINTPRILITGATGGLGSAISKCFGNQALRVTRSQNNKADFAVPTYDQLESYLPPYELDAIVHCANPLPDNQAYLEIEDIHKAVEENITKSITAIQKLSKLLIKHGTEHSIIILFGSTFAKPGRHNFNMPLYSMAKNTLPILTRILAKELAPHGKRAVLIELDTVDGGMNEGIHPRVKMMHKNRHPFGHLATPQEIANQIKWVIENNNSLLSGSTISLTGGSMP